MLVCPACYSRRVNSTLIRLTGRDALDLLHRITTQHLRDLEPGRCRTTLFCDFRGRVQHRVAVARGVDDTVWLARADAPGAELLAVLDRQIFRDDVKLEDLSASSAVTLAPAAAGAEASTLEEHDGAPMRLHLEGDVDLAVNDSSVAPLDEPGRIRLGVPRHGHEIRDAFNAFEIGLARDVHLDKGCFTGQEALLRMMTYGGVRRRLALLEGTGTQPAAGDALRRDDQDAGVITSVGSEGGGWIALAVLRRDALTDENSAALTTAAGAATFASVKPFPDARPLGLPDSPAPRA
jgi:folate-binding protein YgfZ